MEAGASHVRSPTLARDETRSSDSAPRTRSLSDPEVDNLEALRPHNLGRDYHLPPRSSRVHRPPGGDVPRIIFGIRRPLGEDSLAASSMAHRHPSIASANDAPGLLRVHLVQGRDSLVDRIEEERPPVAHRSDANTLFLGHRF